MAGAGAVRFVLLVRFGDGDVDVEGREALKACMSKPKEGTGRLA